MKKENQEKNIGKTPIIKFVRKAGMWCKTWWNEKGEQKIEWFGKEPK